MQNPTHPLSDYLKNEAPFFYLLFDGEGVVREANRFTTALLGEVTGKPFSKVFVDFHGTMNLAELSADSTKFHRLDVNTVSCLPQTTLCSFHRHSGFILALGHVDISEMQALQQSFIELNNEMNVIMRQLQKANAKLEKLSALKNRFVGFAAHDLRRPIGVILSYSEFLQAEARDQLSPEHGEFLDIIQTRAEAMNRMLEDLLDIAMIESGRNDAKLETAELAAIFRTVELTLQASAYAKQVTLDAVLDPTLPRLQMDPLKIEQTVLNLAANAVEHTRPGTTVRLEARRDGGNALVSVSDHGPGVPAAMLSQLFEPFARAEHRKEGGHDSHGLGLAIAKRMVEAHRGKIWVENKPGEGATFCFTLPLGDSPETGNENH